MSLTSRNPIRTMGQSPWSGGVNTGQTLNTIGGQQVFSNLSGVNADTLIWSGAGRLDTMTQLNPATSGRNIAFYDGTVATSGGPFQTSGHKVLGVLVAQQAVTVSGALFKAFDGVPIQVGGPFFSGLYAANIGGSGTAGWSVTFSPEASGFPVFG